MAFNFKQIWSTVDKKTLTLFGGIAFGLWIMMIGIFFMTMQSYDILPQEDTEELFEDTKLNLKEDGEFSVIPELEDFTPEFQENTKIPASENLYAHKELMELYLKRGNYSRSSNHLELIEKYFKNDSAFLEKSVELFHALGQFNKAQVKAVEALKFDPENIKLQNIEIRSLYRMGSVNEAMTLALERLKKNPTNLELLTTLGMMEIESKSGVAGNSRYLKKALKINPKYVPALYQIARKHKLEGNYSDSRAVLLRAIKLEPANAKLHGHLGAVYYYLNRDNLALKKYETALILNPLDFNTWYNLGELQLARSYIEKSKEKKMAKRLSAFESYQKAIELYPSHEKANFRIGVLLAVNLQFKEAIQHFMVVRAQSEDVRVLLQIASAYEHLGQLQIASEYLTKAFQIDPTHKVVIHKLKLLSTTS